MVVRSKLIRWNGKGSRQLRGAWSPALGGGGGERGAGGAGRTGGGEGDVAEVAIMLVVVLLLRCTSDREPSGAAGGVSAQIPTCRGGGG